MHYQRENRGSGAPKSGKIIPALTRYWVSDHSSERRIKRGGVYLPASHPREHTLFFKYAHELLFQFYNG